jgi:hypothetical protein
MIGALIAACLAAPAEARGPITGPAIDLPAEIAADAQVDVIRMSTDWLNAREDFSDTFDWQVGAHLRQCAKGKRKLTLRTHIPDLRKEDLIGRLFRRGEHQMLAAAELIDRKSKAVVARYYFDLGVDSGAFAKALVAEPELMLSQAYGKELCAQAFEARD